MGKKKEYKEANRRSITKFWKLAKVRFLRVRGVLLPCITKEV